MEKEILEVMNVHEIKIKNIEDSHNCYFYINDYSVYDEENIGD